MRLSRVRRRDARHIVMVVRTYNDRMTEPQRAVATSPVGLSDVEAEHAMQYKLLAEAERLLGDGNLENAREVVRQLQHYSEAHFGSEQVLMRLHSYPGYQAHVREHGELLAILDALSRGIDETTASSSAGAIRRWLTAHIHHADQAFLDHLKSA